jgi:AbrB family looped-hinge helix DNA binding protein
MDEFIRKVYERGKVTIPKELRDLYGVKDGDLVKLRIIKVIEGMEDQRQKERAIEITARVETEHPNGNGHANGRTNGKH